MTRFNLVAVACSKMEQDYLLEWIEFHKLIGVQHFFIYDSMHDLAWVTLQKHIQRGEVTLIPWLKPYSQWEIYWHFCCHYGSLTKWAAILDIDEYLCPKTFDHLGTWLKSFENETFSAVGIGWVMFGSNYHEKRPAGLITENYTRAVNYPVDQHDIWIKSIIRPNRIERIDDPHFFHSKSGYYTVDPLKRPIHISQHSSTYPLEDIQLNHYFCKSREDFVHKVYRGSADIHDLNPERKRKLEDFEKHNSVANNVEDSSILRFVPRLKKAIGEISPLLS